MIDNKSNRILKFLFLVFIIIVSMRNASAVGISPMEQRVLFEPNSKMNLELRLVNNEHKDVKVLILFEGEMAQYINESWLEIEIPESEYIKSIYYTLSLPTNIEQPGDHDVNIKLMEFPKEIEVSGTNTVVKGVASVVSKLHVYVPYPEKYLEAKLHVSEKNSKNEVFFTISVFNLGSEDIKEVSAFIDIFDNNYKRVSTIETNKIMLKKSESNKLVAVWKVDAEPAGVYLAIANVDYDNKKIIAEQRFVGGEPFVDVVNVIVDDFSLGQIAEFDILLDSNWNEKLTGVYGDFTVRDNERTYTKFRTSSIEIPPLGKAKLNAYWDTDGISIGRYKVDIILYYADKTTQKSFDINVNLDSITSEVSLVGRVVQGGTSMTSTTTLVTILMVIVVMINIVLFMYIKKLKKQR